MSMLGSGDALTLTLSQRERVRVRAYQGASFYVRRSTSDT
jgi:hypothetical protein